MRIGIDARLYGPKHRGIGRYIQKLIENLEKIDSVNDYIVFLGRDNLEEYEPTAKNFIKKTAPFRWYSLREQVLMPLLLKKENLDLVHFPHFNVPLLFRGKFIVTIHDLIIYHFPNQRATTLPKWIYKIKILGSRLVLKNALERALKIITPSNYTKQDIILNFTIPEKKIIVTYLSATDYLGQTPRVGGSQNLPVPYLLYVGAAYPHKNLERLIAAFKRLVLKYNLDLNLVLVGRKDFFYQRLENWINSLTELSKIRDRIIFWGEVPDSKLPELYKNASVFVYPSLYEGFGLPPLEAMNYRAPVAAALSSSLPEVLGQSCLYFDPKDPEEIARTINKIIKDEFLRESLIEKGFEQVKRYSWENCAKETLMVYKNCMPPR